MNLERGTYTGGNRKKGIDERGTKLAVNLLRTITALVLATRIRNEGLEERLGKVASRAFGSFWEQKILIQT